MYFTFNNASGKCVAISDAELSLEGCTSVKGNDHPISFGYTFSGTDISKLKTVDGKVLVTKTVVTETTEDTPF